MKKRYDEPPRFSATSVATITILAVIVAMGLSLVVHKKTPRAVNYIASVVVFSAPRA